MRWMSRRNVDFGPETDGRTGHQMTTLQGKSRIFGVELSEREASAVEDYSREQGVKPEELLAQILREQFLPLIMDYDLPDEEERRARAQRLLEREDLAWDEDGTCALPEPVSAQATS